MPNSVPVVQMPKSVLPALKLVLSLIRGIGAKIGPTGNKIGPTPIHGIGGKMQGLGV